MSALLKAASAYVGAPYRLHGRTPAGWDCWGCVRWLRSELLGRESPDWGATYSDLDAVSAERTAALIAERLGGWREVPPHPGAVLLFAGSHVGLVLSARDFIHASREADTVIDRLDARPWRCLSPRAFEAR